MAEELPFRVEEWDAEWRGRISTLATAADLIAARAAYRVLVERRPDAALMLCDRARILDKSESGLNKSKTDEALDTVATIDQELGVDD